MTKRIPKTGASKPASSKKAKLLLQLPSKVGCDTCIINMNTEDYNCSLINESLTSKEKIVNFDKLLYRYERIQIDAIPNEIIKLKRLRQIEVDKIEQLEASANKKKIRWSKMNYRS
jgi:hypothetical protein